MFSVIVYGTYMAHSSNNSKKDDEKAQITATPSTTATASPTPTATSIVTITFTTTSTPIPTATATPTATPIPTRSENFVLHPMPELFPGTKGTLNGLYSNESFSKVDDRTYTLKSADYNMNFVYRYESFLQNISQL